MDIFATLHKLPAGSATEAEELVDDFNELGKPLTRDEIVAQLKKDSEFRQKAKEAGLIRPFLLLASMHPVARYQAARPISVKLLKKYNHDPHAEAWAVLTEDGKGLKSRTEYSFEFAKKSCDWYTMVWRAEDEALKATLPSPTKVENKSALCNDSSNPTVAGLELDMLLKLAEKQHKTSKENDDLVKVVDKLLSTSESKSFFSALKLKADEEKALSRFLLELVVQEILAEEHGDDDKKKDKPVVTFEVVAKKIQTRLFTGYDPYTKKEKNTAIAKNVAVEVASNVGANVLMTLCPPVGLACVGVQIARQVGGPSHDKTFETIVQILIHKLLLATQGVYIESFY
eukprot:TRINITY_DN774_c0_g1_i3.p1 TRINITY_DN774_c0_g1~~TRINITY_DN774_c0_g1_i3.p1  ORF type:complete len:343 (-),score=137.64 TRINITY_DN774_c0_g1_i3:47-1075(-)